MNRLHPHPLLLNLAAALAAALGIALPAQTTVLKLGTLAPDRSLWHQAIQPMGSDWRKATSGGHSRRAGGYTRW